MSKTQESVGRFVGPWLLQSTLDGKNVRVWCKHCETSQVFTNKHFDKDPNCGRCGAQAEPAIKQKVDYGAKEEIPIGKKCKCGSDIKVLVNVGKQANPRQLKIVRCTECRTEFGKKNGNHLR